jgi:uncharacterized protein
LIARETIDRRVFLKRLGGFAGGSAAGLLGFATYEPHELSIERVNIDLPQLPPEFDGFQIAQLSDIHFDEFVSADHLRKAIAAINASSPDVVVLTGDFVTDPLVVKDFVKAAKVAYPCAEVLRSLRSRHGVFATLGNHDYVTRAEIVNEALAGAGIPVLRNRAEAIAVGGRRLWIAGLDDALLGMPAPELALRGIPASETVIALVHEPDFADRLSHYRVALQLSGHSHGGQVRFPLIGAPYLPELSRKYPMGFYRVGNLQLYTNRGLGVIGLPFRFMCPPELTLLSLHSGDARK